MVREEYVDEHRTEMRIEYRLFRCAGCGRGGLGIIQMPGYATYPSKVARLIHFSPDVRPAVPLPKDTPKGIKHEFRESERCLRDECYRAAAAMFRSALERTLTAAGYKVDQRTNLYRQVEAAAADGTITEARKRRAHDEIRVLGNDVLHDEWKSVSAADAVLAGDHTQRIIEDFYDHRASTLARLREKGRVPAEDRKPEQEAPEGA